jgi:hypothetical protein
MMCVAFYEGDYALKYLLYEWERFNIWMHLHGCTSAPTCSFIVSVWEMHDDVPPKGTSACGLSH